MFRESCEEEKTRRLKEDLKATCGKQERELEKGGNLVIRLLPGSCVVYMCRGPTDPARVSHDPAMARQPAILFSTPFEPLPPELAGLPVLSPIVNGLFQPLIQFPRSQYIHYNANSTKNPVKKTPRNTMKENNPPNHHARPFSMPCVLKGIFHWQRHWWRLCCPCRGIVATDISQVKAGCHALARNCLPFGGYCLAPLRRQAELRCGWRVWLA